MFLNYLLIPNMETWLTFLIPSICLVMDCVSYEHDWSYDNTSKWDGTWKSCAGSNQSPLNIIDYKAATLTSNITLTFENFSSSVEAILTNNGKTAKLEPPLGSNISVTGNRLYINNHYRLKEVHFHWGGTFSGSEHKLNGKSASMEVQLVNYNINYSNFETAKEKFDGILVLSVLVDVSTDVPSNSIWKKISDGLPVILSPGSKNKLDSGIKFMNLLPRNVDDFYLYKGSFTTPPCFETVTWVVFRERLKILKDYLDCFTALRTNTSTGIQHRLATNTRPVKPLNSRTVLKTFQLKAPVGQKFEEYVYEKAFNGMDMVCVVRFYKCHIPASLSLSIIIPSLDITWKSQNLTSDIQKEPIDTSKPYSVRVEMHDHPKGIFRDQVHLSVYLDSQSIIENFYDLCKRCLQDSCFWSSMGISRSCTRRLINSEEELTFNMTRHSRCGHLYDVTIKRSNRVIFKMAMKAQTRVSFTFGETDQQLHGTPVRWYITLKVHTVKNSSHAKLFLNLLYSSLSSQSLLMDGVFHNAPNCYPSSSGTPSHVKLIVGITVGLFIVVVIILTVCLVYKTMRRSPKANILVQEDELDTAV